MRVVRTVILCAAFAAPSLATSALAQEMYPGQGVTVNPAAAGTRVLLYPGGQYVRVLPPLAEPGAPYPGQALPPVHLHMPEHHRVAHAHHTATQVATAETPTDTTTAAPEEPAQPAPVHHKHQKPTVTSGSGNGTGGSGVGGIPFSLDGNNVVSAAPATPAPAPTPKPARVATADPPAHDTPHASSKPTTDPALTKRGEIAFNHDATDPAPVQYDGLKRLAGELNSALQSGAAKIEIQAYGGNPGDKSSDARRISLRRALAVRQVLIDDGVPSGKIDVRAMGGIDDGGNADRVDVFSRA